MLKDKRSRNLGWFGGEQLSLLAQVGCNHEWQPYGAVTDKLVKCPKCGKIEKDDGQTNN